MQMKNITMMLVAGCTVGMLAGCGVPEEEHLAALAQQEAMFKAEEDKLNVKIAEQESIIKNEKAKVRTSRIELDDASERITGLQQKSAATATALATEKAKASDLESALKTSKSAAAAAQDQALESERKYNTLDVEYQELKRRFEMFQKNMSSLDDAATPASAPPAAAGTAPKTDADKVNSLLEQMGTM